MWLTNTMIIPKFKSEITVAMNKINSKFMHNENGSQKRLTVIVATKAVNFNFIVNCPVCIDIDIDKCLKH